MGEETLVFRGENRVANDRRNVVVPGDLAILPRELDERDAVGVVDVADGRKLEPGEWTEVGQVIAIDVDVMQRGQREQHGDHRRRRKQRRACEQRDDATSPGHPV